MNERYILNLLEKEGWKVKNSNWDFITLTKKFYENPNEKTIHINKETGFEGFTTDTVITPYICCLIYKLFECWGLTLDDPGKEVSNKEKPMKVKKRWSDDCPRCGEFMIDTCEYVLCSIPFIEYCPHCGQRLDWSEF